SFVGLHRRDAYIRTLTARGRQNGAHTVRPMLVLAQVHVDPRAELSAKDAVYELKSDGIGIILRRGQLRAKNHALPRSRTVDQVDHVLLWLPYVRHSFQIGR